MSNIPVLPVVVKPMKDAARAAKVSARWAMHSAPIHSDRLLAGAAR
jgi:hypothetical protein